MFLTRFFIGKPLLEDSTFHRKIGNKLREYYKNPDAEIVIFTDVRQNWKKFFVKLLKRPFLISSKSTCKTI